MGIKRIVDTSFWTDPGTEDFTPEDKYFMVYILTNPFTTQLGIYGISIKNAAFQLGYSIESTQNLIDRFENKYGIIIYSKETKEIAIKNFLRHSILKGGAPVRDCLIKELKKVKNKDLIASVFSHIKGDENLNETVKSIIAEYEEKNGVLQYCHEKQKDNEKKNDNEKENEKENENENENDNDNEVSYPDSCNESLNDTFKAIIAYLNQRAGTNYKASSKKTQSCIHARLKDGFTIEDFGTVIDKKCSEWIGTEYEKYLRPETLFGTKFEGYLNARINPKQSRKTNIQNRVSDIDNW